MLVKISTDVFMLQVVLHGYVIF